MDRASRPAGSKNRQAVEAKLSEVDGWIRGRGADENARGRGADEDAPVRFPKRTRPVRRGRAPEQVVLVIDDDKLVRDTVGEFLEDEGYGLLLVSDGSEALELLARAAPKPCLIILDLKMPNLDGWAFRQKQAEDPKLASIPVILVTALPTPNIVGAAILRKPLYLDQLAAAMERVLVKHQHEPALQGVLHDGTAVQGSSRCRTYNAACPPSGDVDSAGTSSDSVEVAEHDETATAESVSIVSIVILDDSEDNAEMLAELLLLYGHRVRVANHGRELFELIEEDVPDVILIDISLPDMNGYDVAALVRARFGWRIHLVAMTGFSGTDVRQRAACAGFNAFVNKPFHPEDVLKQLQGVA